jgi:Dienelactone hydrolase family
MHGMLGKVTQIRSRGGGEFDCYLVTPEAENLAPAVVIVSAVHGVDADMCGIADELAAQGFIVAAPDLFRRSISGPLSRDDHRPAQRSLLRLDHIRLGEDDMADTLTKWRATCAHPGPDFRDFEGLSSAATRDIGPMTGFALKSKSSDEKLATAATLGQLEETPDDFAASLFAYDLALHSSR